MDDEFALCWNNFQDNIATGFQNLYDRGDLVDVTLACDGKLLQAHKIVLAICSPYFQEMFITNPCKHPIIILKDVTYTVMSELLQFMYQGVVNVKHTDLASFMKIAQALQIKGLATSMQKQPSSPIQSNNSICSKNSAGGAGVLNSTENFSSSNNVIETKINTALFANKADSLPATSSGGGNGTSGSSGTGHHHHHHPHHKRSAAADYSGTDSTSIYPKKQIRRTSESGGGSGDHHDINTESMDMSSDDVFMPPIPHISMVETSSSSRFDLNNVKRENTEPLLSPGGAMRAIGPPFNFEYNSSVYSSKNIEYPNDLNVSNEFTKGGSGTGGSGGANHMDIPPGGNITMLSSTSLLHGNCIFNRNNTVATQQGMKTYWLCKSYRITMCRARCITHQGRVISATGVHNHQPHMKAPPSAQGAADFLNTIIQGGPTAGNHPPIRLPSSANQSPQHMLSGAQQQQQPHQQQLQHQHQQHPQSHQHHQQPSTHQSMLHSPSAHSHSHHHHHHHPSQQQHPQSVTTPTLQQQHHHHQLHHHHAQNHQQQHQQQPHNNAAVIQNMMHNVLSQNNLMQLTNMTPILNPLQQHSAVAQLNNIHPPSSLQITPILSNNQQSLHSPTMTHSPRLQHQQQDSPNMQHHTLGSNGGTTTPNHNNSTTPNMSIVVTTSSVTPTASSPDDLDHQHRQEQQNVGSSESNLISSIAISPTTEQSFKLEHI